MKILHIGKYYPPHMGGIKIYFQQLVLHQSKVMDVAAIVASDLRRTQVKVLDGAEITRVTSLSKSHTHIMQSSCYEVRCDSGMN